MDEGVGGGVVVGSPRPVWPNPRTKQYGFTGKPSFPEIPRPRRPFQGQGWVQAWIQTRADADYLTFAEKHFIGRGRGRADSYQSFTHKFFRGNDRERWYFATVDGWVLTFWDGEFYDPQAAQEGHVRPSGWLDLRWVHSATWRPVKKHPNHLCPFEVIVHMRNGAFIFRVAREEHALRWVQCITEVFVEWQAAEMQRMEAARLGADLDRDAESRPGAAGKSVCISVQRNDRRQPQGGDDVLVSPYRAQALRQLWIQCLRTAMHGETPNIFTELFWLYDENGDGTMQVQELEVLLQELLTIRRSQLRRSVASMMRESPQALLAETKAQRSEREELGQLADNLEAYYNDQLNGPSFRARSLLLRSQLDISRDERVSREEFVRGAPELLMPGRELRMEAKFYERLGHRMQQAAALEDFGEESEDEGGCIQQ